MYQKKAIVGTSCYSEKLLNCKLRKNHQQSVPDSRTGSSSHLENNHQYK